MQRKLRTRSYGSLGASVNPASRKKAEDALPRWCVTQGTEKPHRASEVSWDLSDKNWRPEKP